MRMMEEKELYKSLAIVLIISIVIVLAFNLYMRSKIMEKEEFSLLYFDDHELLPEKVYINESFNISIGIANHKSNITNYILEIKSNLTNFSNKYNLHPDEYKEIELNINPQEKGWELLFSTNQVNTVKLNSVDGSISDQQDSDYSINGTIEYYPLSHNLSGFGEVYHTNLTVQELEQTPFIKNYNLTQTKQNRTETNSEDIRIYMDNGQVYSESNITESVFTSLKSPFVVKFYEVGSNVNNILDIYFWYEVK